MKRQQQIVLGRGINIFCQLGPRSMGRTVEQFEILRQFESSRIEQIDSYFSNNVALLSDNQLVYWGWALDGLTQIRTLNWYKQFPRIVYLWQTLSPLGRYLGMRNYFDHPNLMNKQMLDKPIKKVQLGCGFIQILTRNGLVYGMGDNYKGQLGQGDTRYRFEFEMNDLVDRTKVIDIGTGFQHSLCLDSQGIVFGAGKASRNQIIKSDSTNVTTNTTTQEYYTQNQKIEKRYVRFKQLACGFHHNILLSEDGELYGFGENRYGQCGASNLNKQYIDYIHKIYSEQKMDGVVCGFNHSVAYNQKSIYVWGSNSKNQANKDSWHGFDECSPQKVELDLEEGEIIQKVKARFDRSCVITNRGNCYIWGGDDLRSIGGDYHQGIQNLRDQVGRQYAVRDVGLGYGHIILVCDVL